jgi:hypothetical protein
MCPSASYPIAAMSNSLSSDAVRSYAPHGVVKNRRLRVGLMPAELEQCKQLAAECELSQAALVREVYLVGLPYYLRQRARAANKKA